ncbi:MAG TPA: glycosyltransferase family 2 protein [Pyrinomonadaceae bacterium]|nr:glycosyltransferase family 2 protein [Pyrinomonadaceae bacterium]
MVLTFNEAANITRTIEKLLWAERILIIDSGSTDGTLKTLAAHPQVQILQRPFDSFADQCNFGLGQVRTEWVLSLDADYELSDELVQELQELQETESVAAYRASFTYCIYGRRLRRAIYPPRTILYRVGGAHYVNEGHGHRIQLAGEVRNLRGVVYHDDRKPVSRWLAAQRRYAELEVNHLLDLRLDKLPFSDRLRRMGWPAPILVFFYVAFVRGCLLDGWAGWFYVLQRVLAEGIIALELIDRRFRSATKISKLD